MQLSRFKKTWGEALRDSATKNMVIAALILANIIAVFGWFQSKQTVVLVPPGLNEEVTVSASAASAGYKKAWALYVATLLGNVTPGNADFVMETTGELLAPDVFRAIRELLAEQVRDIKDDSLTVSFEPRQVSYEPETEKVFVYGMFQSRGPSGTPQSFTRTYEMNIDMRFGRPWITSFRPYSGLPRTVAYLKTQRGDAERLAAEE